MALDPMIWAVKDAPVADVEEHAVLTVMADEADESGCGAFLATATIAKRAKVSKKTAQRRIDDMLERKILGLGDQRKAAYIRADRRPIVYDILIPFSWYSKVGIERVNEARAGRGLPPLTPENRPDIAPPPPPKRRADYGTKRAKDDDGDEWTTSHPVDDTTDDQGKRNEVSTSHPVDGVTSSPAGLVNRHGVTSKDQAETPPPAETPPRGDYGTPDPVFDPVIDPSPLPSVGNSPAASAGAVQGGRFDDETKDMLAAALAAVQSLKPGWKPDDVRAAMIAEIDDGRTSAAVARAVVELAKDPATQGPGRLKHAGPWWNEPAGGAEGPVRYIDREAARCGKHRGEPADGCGKCKAEQYAPEYDQTREQLDAPTDAAAARALIRQATAAGAAKYKTQTRRGTSPSVAATRAGSSALDALTAAAAELEGTTDDEMFAPVVEPESVRELAQVAAS